MYDEKETMKGRCCGGYGGGKRWFLIPLCVIAMVFIVSGVVMFLWNGVVPHVFTSLGPITYYQAIYILILSKILFGGFRKGGGDGWRGRRAYQWKQKWMSMSEEERAKFKEEWKSRGGDCKC